MAHQQNFAYWLRMAKLARAISLETSLGRLTVQVSVNGESIAADSLSLTSSAFEPSLPVGMQVVNCRAVLISVERSASRFTINYSATLETEVEGGSCTGQFLEAIEWEDQRARIVVGTEDAEQLSRRMPWQDLKPDDVIARYSASALELSLVGNPHSQQTTFHLIVAENPVPEPAPDSAWFAVDSPHKSVLNVTKANICT
ncbi:MAG: hypothetical protein AAF768_01650 [Pseudomonadota bacterium]